MEGKLLLSQSHYTRALPPPQCYQYQYQYPSKKSGLREQPWQQQQQHQLLPQSSWPIAGGRRRSNNRNRKRGEVCCSLVDSFISSCSPPPLECVANDILLLLLRSSSSHIPLFHSSDPSSLLLLEANSSAAAAAGGYSLASYYTSLGLFVISVPGLWSLIKRSVKSKIVQKTYVVGEGKAPNQVAGEILSFFTRNNFMVLDRGETITFEGIMVPNRGQAALLTFCTCLSLASIALVLTITVPDVGNNWFWLTALSPLAGLYYWKKASRKEQIKVKMMVADDGMPSEITVQGDDQQVEEMRKELQLSEKGMVYVKGLFER